MQQQVFTPINPFDIDQPRSWASEVAKLDWDSTQICFTKRNLINFLRNIGITVGTNFTEISKLPKHATFGNLSPLPDAPPTAMEVELEEEEAKPNPAAFPPSSSSSPAPVAPVAQQQQQQQQFDEKPSAFGGNNGVRPSRRVRDPPGGAQTLRFGDDSDGDDASLLAPPVSKLPVPPTPSHPHYTHNPADIQPAPTPTPHSHSAAAAPPPGVYAGSGVGEPVNVGDSRGGWKPTRRVRHGPGGPSSMAATLMGGYDDSEPSDVSTFRTGKKQIPRDTSNNWGPL